MENGPFDRRTESNVVLQTERVILRPWQIEDARWYVESRDEEVFEWTSENRALTVREAEAAIQQLRTKEHVFSFALVERESNKLLGNIALVLDEEGRRSGEVMYWLAPWGRGRGVASHGVKLLCQWAFDALGLENIVLKTHVGNLRSQRVAERCGFQKVEYVDDREAHPDRVWFVLSNRMNPE